MSNNNNITSEELGDDDEIPNPMRCRNCYSSIFRIYDGWTSNPKTGKTRYKNEKIAVCIECEGHTIVNHLKDDYDGDNYGDYDDNDSDSRKLQEHISK